MFIRNFKILGEVVIEKSLTKYFIGEKKDGQIKGKINMRILLSYPIFVPNFKILGAVVAEKSFDTNFPMHYTGVRDGKREKKVKRSQNKFQHFGFLLHKILQHSVGVYKI